jgi:TatD DNase family protein
MAVVELTDTHCHIHEAQTEPGSENGVQSKWAKAGITDPKPLILSARAASVTRLICVGTTTKDSELAIRLAANEQHIWASIGIHPHDADSHLADESLLGRFRELATKPQVVAVGECGLDYFYGHSSKAGQEKILRMQLDIAREHDLPLIFHVREAFDDFWPIFDAYKGLRGVMHSFSATKKELEQVLERGLYVGLNGIMTFTKRDEQLAAAKAVPLDKLLLETDAPYLTPTPLRGTVCEPKHLRITAEFLTQLRGESLVELAAGTTSNARMLFGLS